MGTDDGGGLSDRQRTTVEALLQAGIELIREDGYDRLTMRTVATRAGVTHTTAYAYFSSKDQLLAEMLWRRLRAIPTPVPDPAASLTVRIGDAFRGPGLVFADEPELAQAGMAALLGNEPDVQRVRDSIGGDLVRRIRSALGDDADPELTEALILTFTGAMLQAGMGYFDFAGVVERMESVARQLDHARR
jgi:AcrR family transcriptional regulator